MLTNGGDQEGLFRGAYMESGTICPMGDMEGAQQYYDDFVAAVGCADAPDTLACLRYASFDELKAAMDASPTFFSYQVGIYVDSSVLL